MINRDDFYKKLKAGSLLHSLTPTQVAGFNALMDKADAKAIQTKQFAYMLATAYHETSTSMQPIKEYGGNAYYTKMYDIGGKDPKRAIANGNTTAGDGAKYCGRGYVQLTWKNNYKKADIKLALNGELVKNPDMMLNVKLASDVMYLGMTEGWFTGKKLSDYISATKADYVNARRIINGIDCADKIAHYAEEFEKALS